MIHVHPLDNPHDRQWNTASLVMVAAVLVAIGIFHLV